MLEPDETGRRIKAARMLAGIPSADALAERIDSAGLGAKTMRKIESGARPVRPHELREIARTCGVPFGFLTLEWAEITARLSE